MDTPLILSNEELRRRLSRYKRGKGKKIDYKINSTVICINDILLLSKINNKKRLWDFLMGRATFGRVVRKRLTDLVLLLDAGRITKTQYGAYHFHDEPVGVVVREMSVRIFGAGISLTRGAELKPQAKMPDFGAIFKGM